MAIDSGAFLALTPTILLYSIAAAIVTVYVPFSVAAIARVQLGKEALSAPRAMIERLPPYAQRATWAHENGFEVLLVYGLAALCAYVTGVESTWGAIAAIVFVVARLFYALFYILDLPPLRSLSFGIGTACSVTLFILSYRQI
jgi:uncharacterized MAPEG superfamily protein